MRVLKKTKIVLRNRYKEKLVSTLPDYYFKLCQGVVGKYADFEKKEVEVKPVVPRDFKESRIVSIDGFEIKGAGRVLKDSIEEIDLFGPYETGPPGGLFLEFAKKELRNYKSTLQCMVNNMKIGHALVFDGVGEFTMTENGLQFISNE